MVLYYLLLVLHILLLYQKMINIMQIYMKTMFVYNGMKINRFGKIQKLHYKNVNIIQYVLLIHLVILVHIYKL